MNSRAWRRSLSRRAALRYFALVVLASVLISGIFYFFWKTNLLRVEQSVHWEVAQELVRRIEQHPEVGEVTEDELREIVLREFYYLSAVNPRLDPYLLDESGAPVVSLYSQYRLQPISLEPIQTFLQQEGFPDKPIYGANPQTDGPQTVPFVAASIRVADRTAIVYVVASGKRYWTAFQQFTDRIAIVGSIILLLIVGTVSAGLGHLVFLHLSRSLRTIIDVAQTFASGDFSRRVVLESEDELGTVATTMNSMAERITESIRQAAHVDSMRRELVSNISHDVRHPVAVMQTALESLLARLDSVSKLEQQDALSRALDSCKQLNVQLDELFSLAKLNSTDYQLRIEEFSLAELCEEVLLQNQGRAVQGQIELEVKFADRLPHAKADIALIERVLTNLLANAIRHTQPGGRISLSIEQGEDTLDVTVSDTGSGIPADHLPYIFERYFTAAREGKGSGLGLAIVKRIVELHRSVISVTSVLGQGTEFRFSVPSAMQR